MISQFAKRALSNSRGSASILPRWTPSASWRGMSTNNVEDQGESLEDKEAEEWRDCRRGFIAPLRVKARGSDILNDPLFNKGTAFKSAERDRLRFRGLLPARVMNILEQKEFFLNQLRMEDSNIRKNRLMEDMHDMNETLYHRLLVDHIEEMAPIIYTPTVRTTTT